jgi:hypothetical protein
LPFNLDTPRLDGARLLPIGAASAATSSNHADGRASFRLALGHA